MAADIVDSPERLDVEDKRGGLIVSEHRGRYLWAAQIARGMKVLDAGCGTGYGLEILGEAGALRVVGVDISAEAVKKASASSASKQVEVHKGDLRALPFSDGEFDLVVCFEVIEHVAEREQIMDELSRVLGPNGALCISTPNRRVYPPGNPYHIHEYTPEELAEALGKRYSNTAFYRQTAWLASAILSDAEFVRHRADQAFSLNTVKIESKAPGEETFTVALASGREIPKPESLLALGEPFEVRWWEAQIGDTVEKAETVTNEVQRQAFNAHQAADAARERSLNSAKRLLEVEEFLSVANARVFALEEELNTRIARLDATSEQLERTARIMAAMTTSLSWRITSPLRALKRRR